jgi:hypothetical protein
MILMQGLVSALQMNVLGIHMTGVKVTSEELWAFCLGGLTPVAPMVRRSRRPTPGGGRRLPGGRRPIG